MGDPAQLKITAHDNPPRQASPARQGMMKRRANGNYMLCIRPMTIEDYDLVFKLLKKAPGITFRDADSRENTARYLVRNPGFSFVALDESRITGCIMAGHDGRRGYLQHLMVDGERRHEGIASALLERCLAALEANGIFKFHIDVLADNEEGAAYWESRGWQLRSDIKRYSFIGKGGNNA
ncbi:MAG TPA: GNAT family N-acetyltransferase [Herbaspirillum sp.]|jgi:ribosomal protein S18 acetylase RimI-like enzyme